METRSTDPTRPRVPVEAACGFAVILLLSIVAVELRPSGAATAVWWPASGAAVGWMLRSRLDKRLLLACVALAGGLGSVVAGRSPELALALSVGNCTEVVMVTWCLTRGGHGLPALAGVVDVVRFLAATLLGALSAGTIAGLSVHLAMGAAFLPNVQAVTLAHSAAILLIAPLALVRRQTRSSSAPRTRLGEGVAQWALVLSVTGAVFSPGQDLPVAFLPMPALVWAAVRSGPRAACWQMLTVGVLATLLTTIGGGPFARATDALGPATVIGLVQLFIIVYSGILLVLSLGVDSRGAAADRVADQEALYREGFDEAMLGMLLVRVDGPDLLVLELNDVAARLLRATRATLLGAAWNRSVAAEDRPDFDRGLRHLLAGDTRGWHGELRMTLSGSHRWMEVAIASSGQRRGGQVLSLQMMDVTDRHDAHEQMTALALHDPLTGLPNRLLLLDRLTTALARSARTGVPVTVAYLDLDGFKHVNDTAGHAVGDAVLVETAQRLRTLLRPADTASRLGGDEFAVVCEGTGHVGSDPRTVTDAVAQRLTLGLEQTIETGAGPLRVGVSVGVATGGAESTAAELLSRADDNMYVVKRASRAQAQLASTA